MTWYSNRDGYESDLNESNEACIINIGGAVAENHADADNLATNSNFFQSGGQIIEIGQTASASTTNITNIVIGPPYPLNFTINDAGKYINVEILGDGEIKLNGETMDIKQLNNGIKVMFLHNDSKDVVVNNKDEKNLTDVGNNG